MRHSILHSLAALLAAAFSCNPVSAQTLNGQNPSGSAVSPYLNLMRPGTLGGINYYDLVLPQMQFQNAISGLQSNQSAMIQGVAASNVTAGGFVPTGHPIAFGYYSDYFPGGVYGAGFSSGGMLPGQRSIQNQRRMYSPMSGLGGMGMNVGIGGMQSGGMNPGIANPGAAPR